MDSILNYNIHISKIINKATKILELIMRNCKSFTNFDTVKSLLFALLRSTFEYGSIKESLIYNENMIEIE